LGEGGVLASGLLALLDDVAAIAKVAAASLDDVAAQSAKAGAKAAGVVIDDAAVTPGYVIGFKAERELPIIGKIALGSLRNKLLILLPVALALSAFLPQAITPLLMLGGLYLCFEGAEKVMEAFSGPKETGPALTIAPVVDPVQLEQERVAGAIKTDFILSAEIMAIALAAIPGKPVWEQAIVLSLVGVAITVAVYGAVALIVKADDFGVALARRARAAPVRALGRGLVAFMPKVLVVLSVVGTAAMIWVGGGIVAHGLESFYVPHIQHFIDHWAQAADRAAPQAAGFVGWLVGAALSGALGLAIGFVLAGLAHAFHPAQEH
jgi:hypothetical protein